MGLEPTAPSLLPPRFPWALCLLIAVTSLAACTKKKGGSDGTADGPGANQDTLSVDSDVDVNLSNRELKLGNGIALVAPKSATNLPASEAGKAGSKGPFRLQAGSAFETDDVFVFVDDPSMAALDFASGLLCLLSQSSYTDMVGKGDYVAMVDTEACFHRGQVGFDAAAQSRDSAKKPVLSRMVAHAARDDKKPLFLRFWLDLDQTDQDGDVVRMRVSAKVTVVKGATQINPFGVFKMVYTTQPVDTPPSSAYRGVVEASESVKSQVFLKLYDAGAAAESRVGATLTFDPATRANVEGQANAVTTFAASSDAANTANDVNYTVSYDAQHYLAKDSVSKTERCLDRDDYQINVWRYGVYDQQTGARVLGGSTFRTIRRELAGGQTDYGSYDANSLWFDDATPVNEGDLILVENPRDPAAAPTPYKARVRPGKLYAASDASLPLAQAQATRYEEWVWNGSEYVRSLIKWNATTQRFEKVATWQASAAGGAFVDITPEPYLDVTPTMMLYPEGSTSEVVLELSASNILTGAKMRMETAAPAGDSLTLRCSYSCPKSNITKADVDGGSYYLPDAANAAAMYQYVYNPATGALTRNGAPVAVDFSRLDGSPGFLSSGPMVTEDYYSANVGRPEFIYNIARAPTTYRWTSGSDSSEKLITLIDGAGKPLTLDPPTKTPYEHSQANDRQGRPGSPFYGTQHILEISSWGDVLGIPWISLNEAVSVPAFSLKDGTTFAGFKTKGLDIEERMQDVERARCERLSFDAMPPLPSAADWQDPDIGDMPALTTAPAVVAGALVK